VAYRFLLPVVAALACSPSAAPSEQSRPDPAQASSPAPSEREAPVVKPWISVAAHPVRPDAVGLWRIPPADRERVVSATVRSQPGTTRFLYDGETVTLFLLTEKDWMYRARDDHYRLATRWQGDVLQYRPPFATWTDLARFRDARFETVGDQPPWRFELVPDRAACDAEDLRLLADRPPHDYAIKPIDPSPSK
jgi:hypothetical protein